MKTQSTRTLNRDIFPVPQKTEKVKTKSRVMHADKPQTFLTKGKKPRPETAKPKKPESLAVTEQ
jgi:negative regulator of replication initiation